MINFHQLFTWTSLLFLSNLPTFKEHAKVFQFFSATLIVANSVSTHFIRQRVKPVLSHEIYLIYSVTFKTQFTIPSSLWSSVQRSASEIPSWKDDDTEVLWLFQLAGIQMNFSPKREIWMYFQAKQRCFGNCIFDLLNEELYLAFTSPIFKWLSQLFYFITVMCNIELVLTYFYIYIW